MAGNYCVVAQVEEEYSIERNSHDSEIPPPGTGSVKQEDS